jgi:hypothetical protein
VSGVVSFFGQPIHTQVVSWTVYPQNQASTLSFAVPVLPATGYGGIAAT